MENIKSGLYIVSTPIGNLNDISIRAVEALKNADLVICENPKHSIKILSKLGIKKKLISLHDYNEINTINIKSRARLNADLINAKEVAESSASPINLTLASILT